MFLIDFDDTLFDSQALKRALLETVKKCGVSEEEFWQSYKTAYNLPDGTFSYHTDRHAQVLGQIGFDEEKINKNLKEVILGINKFLFINAKDFLTKIKNLNQKVILLSLGDPAFQEVKVGGAGIKEYFDQIFMVDQSKEEIIEKLLSETKDESVWLVNDKPQESINLHQQFPNLKIVLKKSPAFTQEEYEKSGYDFFDDLLDIYQYVAKHQ